MCGDIHKRQVLYYNDTPIVMPSSLVQQNFGEKVTKHGFLLWDVESRTFEECDIDSDYGFYQFTIGSIDDIENDGEILTNYE